MRYIYGRYAYGKNKQARDFFFVTWRGPYAWHMHRLRVLSRACSVLGQTAFSFASLMK